jgi:hypothetical protein
MRNWNKVLRLSVGTNRGKATFNKIFLRENSGANHIAIFEWLFENFREPQSLLFLKAIYRGTTFAQKNES